VLPVTLRRLPIGTTASCIKVLAGFSDVDGSLTVGEVRCGHDHGIRIDMRDKLLVR
jgi:hypothetical protein